MLTLKEQSSVATPAADKQTLFVDASGRWAVKDEAGDTEVLTRGRVASVSSAAGVVTLDASQDYFTLTLTENVTSWVIDNAPDAFTLRVEITQGAGPYTVAKPGTSPGGTFAVSVGSGDIDVLTITSFDAGTTLRSSLELAYS